MKPMSTNARESQESIATDRHHDALAILRDGDGRTHYWSIYDQAVTVIAPDGGVDYDLSLPVKADDGTVIRTPGEWRDHVADRAGVVEDRLVESVGDLLVESVDP